MAKKVNIARPARDSPVYWDWAVPDAGMERGAYVKHIGANVRHWRKAAHYLNSVRAHPTMRPRNTWGDESELVMQVAVGTGWGGSSPSTVATWLGGKRWLLSGEHRGNHANGLHALGLPEVDGRYLLIGAPDRPAKGVVAWRNRWTVSKGALRNLTVVAGEGIEARSVRHELGARVRGLQSTLAQHERALALAQTVLAEMPDADEARAALAVLERRARRFLGYDAEVEGDVYALNHFFNRRNDGKRTRVSRRTEELNLKAAIMLAETVAAAAENGTDGLLYGVRSTAYDGTPNKNHGSNGRAVYTDAMQIGVEAVAPDWDGQPRCGGGLHYAPIRLHARTPLDSRDAVREAVSYTGGNSYALWIVRAGDERVRIDYKAKAHKLTPLALCGRVYTHFGVSRATTICSTVAGLANRRHNARYAVERVERDIENTRRQLAAAKLTLKNWSKSA